MPSYRDALVRDESIDCQNDISIYTPMVIYSLSHYTYRHFLKNVPQKAKMPDMPDFMP